jgi:hypothetical protein
MATINSYLGKPNEQAAELNKLGLTFSGKVDNCTLQRNNEDVTLIISHTPVTS